MKWFLAPFILLSVYGPTLPNRGIRPSLADLPIISIEGPAQGTTYHIKYRDQQQRNYKAQIDSILADIDKCLSLYRPDSEISAFNRSSRHSFQSPYFYPVLKKSAEVYQATEGAFDPTVLPLVEAYRQGKKRRQDWTKNVDSLLQYVGFQHIIFDSVSIQKRKANVRLDFDSIAQGYTVDVVAAFLETKGITRYMVEIGGEVACRGEKSQGKWWTIGIENPLHPGEIGATVQMADRGMATSGNYRNQYRIDGQSFSHIINPKTGFSAPDSLLSVTVFANNALTADAFDTAFLVMGLAKTKAFLATRPDLDAYLIYRNNQGNPQVFFTEGIRPFIGSQQER